MHLAISKTIQQSFQISKSFHYLQTRHQNSNQWMLELLQLLRHYRRKQMAHALDLADAGVTNPYKVTQLQAMRWCVQAWNNISQSVLVNCWRHTGLLSHLPFTQRLEPSSIDDLLKTQRQ